MPDWNPALYLRYEDERTRPAQELLARVPLTEAARVVDLGCGPGNSTALLAARFPGADLLGIDHSQAMLASASQRLPQVRFARDDITTWAPSALPSAAPDLIYANASLQWVPAHGQLLPRLFAALSPGGVLAVQMPDNHQEPSHRLMRDMAAEAPWAKHLEGADRQRTALLGIAAYYDLLAADAAQVDVWHTTYQHPMTSPANVVEWLRSTGLKPFVDGLPASLQASFLAEYERRVAQAYPARADGRLLLAFPRLFIVAKRKP